MGESKPVQIPRRVPVMTLPDTVFFPQSLLPLHIFEPRYRKMLRDVLSNDRMFAVTVRDDAEDDDFENFEPPCQVATVGVIRACRKNDDNTSNVLLQGLSRIRVEKIVSEAPYRSIEIDPLMSVPGKKRDKLLHLKGRLLGYIGVKQRLGWPISREVFSYLKSIDEPDVVADIAAFSVLDDQKLKQELLETLDTSRRLELLIRHFTSEIDDLRLRKKLQGTLDDDDIWMN